MDWLNFHHLHYFWVVVREGSIAAASRRLHVGRPSISSQLKALETSIGRPLFERRGRVLELTETGQMVHGYADEIFRLGRELSGVLRDRPTGRPAVLRVGIADVLAKLVSFGLLDVALRGPEPVVLRCREEPPTKLFAQLAIHELDLVLCDHPLPPNIDVRARAELLGESSVTVFGTPELAEGREADFPRSLDGAPFLMPPRESAVRRALEACLDDEEIVVDIVSEFDDSALMKTFGRAGHGLFPAPTCVRENVEEQYGVRAIGELATVRDQVWAITPERRHEHPALRRIVELAGESVFGA
ncbi:MAG: LysR family transcriptional regulator [Planctomycetota bacterium]